MPSFWWVSYWQLGTKWEKIVAACWHKLVLAGITVPNNKRQSNHTKHDMIVAIKQYPNKFNTCDNDYHISINKNVITITQPISDFVLSKSPVWHPTLPVFRDFGALEFLPADCLAPNHCWFHGFPPWPCSQNTGKGPSLPSSPVLGMRPQLWQGKSLEKREVQPLTPNNKWRLAAFRCFEDILIPWSSLTIFWILHLWLCHAWWRSVRRSARRRTAARKKGWLCDSVLKQNCGDEMKDFTGHKFNSWNIKNNHPAREVRWLAANKTLKYLRVQGSRGVWLLIWNPGRPSNDSRLRKYNIKSSVVHPELN